MSDQEDIYKSDDENVIEEHDANNENFGNDVKTGGEEEDVKSEPKDDEVEEERKPVALNEDMMPEILLLLCKTGNGLSHAYVRLEATGKDLTDITLLRNYIHLRYVDLSNNNLKDISELNGLTHLLTLKLDFNKLTCLKLDILPYLQQASFSNNKIKSIEINCLPKLEQLNLNNNELASLTQLHSDKFPSLEVLEVRGNKLQTTKGLHLPKIKCLFMAANLLTKIEDFDDLKYLTTLHLRDNKLDNLDGFNSNLKALQYINLRANNISDYNQVKKLNVLPMLRALVLSDSPLTENDDYRLEILVAVRRLERLDKEPFTEDERNEAEDIIEQRRLKGMNETKVPKKPGDDDMERMKESENFDAQ